MADAKVTASASTENDDDETGTSLSTDWLGQNNPSHTGPINMNTMSDWMMKWKQNGDK